MTSTTTRKALSDRIFPNWLDAFQEYTAEFPSKPLFTKWAGISALASALQRKNWTRIIRRRQFGNMFVLLIGPPGSGKSVALNAARDIVHHSKGPYLTPSRITTAAFYNELEQSKQHIVDIKKGKEITDADGLDDWNIHHSITAMIPEFGVFVKPYDRDFMTDLADLYDCPNPFQYKTKTQGNNYAENSWFNLLGACTERYIREAFKADALDQGFPARIILVFEDKAIEGLELFGDDPIDTDSSFHSSGVAGDLKVFENLVTDYQHILTLRGNFAWSEEAQEYLKNWYDSKLKPFPMDPKLVHYNTRRLTHVTKLALIGSVARASTQIITLNDIRWAKATLLEAEKRMPEAVKGLGENQYLGVMEGILKLVATRFHEKSTFTPEHELRQLLYREVPPYYLSQILDSLVLAKQLIVVANTKAPNRKFNPGKKYVITKSTGRHKDPAGKTTASDPQITEIAPE
jgi:energy-coupling factor transporter ATP-binding protein EcfA2